MTQDEKHARLQHAKIRKASLVTRCLPTLTHALQFLTLPCLAQRPQRGVFFSMQLHAFDVGRPRSLRKRDKFALAPALAPALALPLPLPLSPTGSKYKHTGENTTTQGQTQLNHYCGLSQTGVTNYNWLFGWLYKFGHALQKPHGATLRFQYQGWIMVLIRPFSLRTSTNEDLTCLGSISMIVLVAMLSVM